MSNHEDHEEKHYERDEPVSNSRRRSIKIPIPWSSNPIEIRGYDFILIFLVAVIPFGAYFLFEMKTKGEEAHLQIFQALEVQTYVLSLSQDKRDKLNISMPQSLRKRLHEERSSGRSD